MFIEYYDNGSAQLDGATRSNNHRNTNRLKENRKMFNDTTFNRTCLTAICIGVLMAVIMAAPVAANPDLIPVGFDMVGSEVYPGEALEERLYGSVANMTDAGAGPFQVAFFITLDTTNPSAGQQLDDAIDDVAGVPPYDTVEVPIVGAHGVPSDWPVGPAWLVMKVDYGNNIQETHENNNAAFLPVTVLDPLDKDTTITVGPELPEVWYAVPLRTETYHGLGSRLMHPSPVDTIVLSQVEIPVYKTPGTWFDTSLSLIVEILTLDADQMPSTLIAVDTVPGYEIAANWALEDSLKYLVVDLAADKAAAGITLPPGVSCAVMVSQPTADPGNIYLPADDEEVIIYEYAGPCSLELSVALIDPPDKMATVSAGTSTSSYTTFTITGPTFITIPVVNEVTIEYMSHFLNNWPNSLYNGLWVDINDFWLERVGMFSLIDIEVVVAGEVTSYPRSSWEAFGGLSLPDAGMSYQVDGRHLIKVRVNGTEFYRDCFYNESKPLIDQAPWASIEEYDFQDFGGESYNWGYYLMRATAPSTRLGFDADFKIFGHNFENRLDLNLDFLQSYQTNNGLGQSAVTYNNIELVLMNKTLLDETIPGLYVGEFEVGDDVVYRLSIDPYEFDIAEIKVFDGRIFYASVWLGAIAFHVDANVKIELDLAIEAALSTFPEPYGELIVTPSVAVNANLEAELVLLWGVGKVGGEATGIVLMSFPLTMSIVGGEPDVDVNFCVDFDIAWKWWIKVVGVKVAGNSGVWDIYDDCLGKSGASEPGYYNFDRTYYGSPALAASAGGEELMVVFVHADDAQGDQIWFATNEYGVWKEPVGATDTEHPKSDVRVAAIGGTANYAAIWVENTSGMDTTAFDTYKLLEALTYQEITVGLFDDSEHTWSTPVHLTNDNMVDGMPVIAGVEDFLVAAWVRNTDPTIIDQSSMRIYYSTFDGTSWTDPQAIPTQVGYNLQPDVKIDPNTGHAMVVWVQDLDADPYTHEDRSVLSCRINSDGVVVPGSIHTIPTTIGPAAPNLVIGANIKAIAYESYGYMEDSLGGMTQPIGVGDQIRIATSIKSGPGWDATILSANDTSAFGMTPWLTIAPDGQLHLTYREIEKNEPGGQDGEVAYARRTTGVNAAWTEPQRLTNDSLTTYADAIAIDGFGQAVILCRNDSLTDDFMAGFDQIFELATAPDNTPTGQLLDFMLPDGTRLTFEEVVSPGYTASFRSAALPHHNGFTVVGPSDSGICLNIMTTAEYVGWVNVETSYDGWIIDGAERDLVMLHYDGNSWVDITTAVDTANNTVTGLTTTLSPFVLAIPTTCCIPPMRGNVDNDSGDAIDISDLVYLVDYMFTGGPAPTCWAETNIDGSGPVGIEDGSADVDISDLVYLVDYMFTGGPAPLPCP